MIWKINEQKRDDRLSASYFFEKAVDENKNDFIRVGISDGVIQNLTSLINAELAGFENILLEVIENLSLVKTILNNDESLLRGVQTTSKTNCYITMNDPKTLVLYDPPNTLNIISKSYEAATTLAQKIKQDFERLNDTTKDFGLTITEISYGKERVLNRIKNSKLKIISTKIGEPRNGFEREVINSLNKITDCFITNADISFQEPNENFEYDILVCINANTYIDIEVTDYETAREKTHQNRDSLKTELILSTLDKAQRLKATSVIIAKGFPKQTFQQLKETAASRNILFLDEVDYEKTIGEMILKKFIEESESEESRFRSQNYFRRALESRKTV